MTVNVLPVTLPVLVVIITAPVVAACGTVNTSCVGDALVTVANVPLTVTMLFAMVPLKFAPTTVTDVPRVPLVGVKDEMVGANGLLLAVVNTITGSSWVLLLVDEDVPVMTKSITSPVLTDWFNEYGYDVDTDMTCENSDVLELYVTENVPNAGFTYKLAVPVIATVPLAGAVQRSTAPFLLPVYPWTNPPGKIARYNSSPSHLFAPELYVSKLPAVSR